MRCSKCCFVAVGLLLIFAAPEVHAQRRSGFISQHSVSRLFRGRSRLLISQRPRTSLFSVTDFWSNEGNPEVKPSESPKRALMQWVPIEPETDRTAVPAPMTFTEEAIIEPVQHTLPVITPGEPGHSEDPFEATLDYVDAPAAILPQPASPLEPVQPLEPAELPEVDESMFENILPEPPVAPDAIPQTDAEVVFGSELDEDNPFEDVIEQSEVIPEPTETTQLQVQPVTQSVPDPAQVPPLPIDIQFPEEGSIEGDLPNSGVEGPMTDSISPPLLSVAPVTELNTTTELSGASIQQQIQILEDSNSDPESRAKAIELYNQALEHLVAAERASGEADQLETAVNDVPRQLVDVDHELQHVKAALGMEPSFSGVPLAKLNRQVAAMQAAVPQLEQARDAIAARRQQIEERTTSSVDAKTLLLDSIEQAEQTQVQGSDAESVAARTEAAARANMLRNRLALASVQEKTDAQMQKLADAQIELVDAQLEQTRTQLTAAQTIADNIQKQIAEQEAARAKAIAEQVPNELKPFADDNAALAEQLKWLKSHIGETRTQTAEAKALHVRLSRSLERVRSIQARTGLNTTLGLILNHELEHMPSDRVWQRRISGIEDQLHDLSEMEFAIERKDRLRGRYAEDVAKTTTALIQHDPSRRDTLARMGTELSSSHEKLLSEAVTTAQSYSEGLTEFDAQCEELVETIHEFESHINKNVLWIRSNEPLSVRDFAAFGPMTKQFASASLWRDTLQSILNAVQENLVVLAICAFFVLVVLSFGDELRSRLRKVGDEGAVDGQLRLRPMWEAVAITSILAFAWPAIVWALGWSISNSLNASDLALSLGVGLQTASLWLATFMSARWVCCPDGLAHRHFGWSESALRYVHEGLPKVMMWGLPVMLVVATLSKFDHHRWSGSVGRIVFIFGLLGLAFYMSRGLNPKSGLLTRCGSPGSWLRRLKYPALMVGVAMPITLAITSAAGYHHSSLQLARCLEQTWMMGVGLLVVFGLMVRGLDWIIQSFESGRTVRGLGLWIRTSNEDSEEAQEQEEERRELADNREQVYRFLSVGTIVASLVGCWIIWHNVLPALNVVNDVQLWTMTKDVPIATDAPGDAVQTIKQTVPITLGDLIRAFMVLVLTIAAARNLPGLLDTFVLRRLPLDRGGRHAISTISRYVLTTVGLLLTLRQVGVDWASMQWLVAAMTVGLGFGLQEIFANFVSGLIILLERPIRLGDFVTVNGETGFVSKIQFRATTITDLDRRELLVPNKKFITDELINWTLSDPITRLVLPVGIAYGSDTSLVHKLLMEVANEHPTVLKEPEASAVMMEFGDSTLNYELRVFIPRRDEFAQIQHEINTAIDRKFRAANVEIAFPQCDIHVHGLEQLAMTAKRAA